MTALLTRLLGRLPIGWLQLKSNRTRLIAAVGGVTFANVLILMQLGFMRALFATSVLTHQGFQADLVLVSSDFHSLREANPIPRARLFQALGASDVTDAQPIYLATMHWSNPDNLDTTNFRVIGIDPGRETFTRPELQGQLHLLSEPDTALVDRRMRDFDTRIATQVEQGRDYPIEAGGRLLKVRGLFSQGASFDVDGAMVVSADTFLSLFPMQRAGTPTLVLLQCREGLTRADKEAIATQITQSFPERDTLALTKEQFIAAEQNYQSRQTPIGFVFGFGVVMGLFVGLVMVYQVLSTDVQDHLPEYATFKAIGYSPRYFLSIIFEEALCLAGLGFVPGLMIALVLYAVAARATALPITMPWGRPFFVLVLTAAMCIASGAVATRRLNAADPADLF